MERTLSIDRDDACVRSFLMPDGDGDGGRGGREGVGAVELLRFNRVGTSNDAAISIDMTSVVDSFLLIFPSGLVVGEEA